MDSLSRVQQRLLEYYNALRPPDGRIPRRTDLNPQNIKPLLAWVVMARSSGPGNLVPTVIGSAVDEILHMSFTGRNLLDMYPVPLREIIDGFYQTILTTPCGGMFTRNLGSSFGSVKGYRSLLLPLEDRDGEVSQMVGVITVAGLENEAPGFGKPKDVSSVQLLDLRYLDIGFGAPPAPMVPHEPSRVWPDDSEE
ncbi:PAS domain-containing protein [Kordiimonas aestuarii]|uniref:PAS domain-containing protein n=1 Tax=Kordiimonas aestuarii TaxID=1005925 RepID=UPI0021D3E83B|nr:PAS domain-containing protein [Kordiimonas aestuarii]